ncbi:MAG: adenylosuccinate synthase [Gemmatimonadota bacterium]
MVGCQWGDEGKGKIVDVLAADVQVVARYQGGANAGHTVHVGDDEFVLHQIPSGILHDGKRCLLGNGVVLDVVQFFEEHDALVARGLRMGGRVGVSGRAHVLLPYHRALDRAREAAATAKIGTTGRGIGPAYEDKVGRRGLRVGDLADASGVERWLAGALTRAQDLLEALGQDVSQVERETREALALGARLHGLSTEVGSEILTALSSGKDVLLEGAQGTLLDLDQGTYPFVTSSNTTAAGAPVGVGIGPTAIDDVLGVLKAYTTRVGEGPLPTAFPAELDEQVREWGGEYGATTGRPRRCGWFDGVVARHAARVNGLTGLAITKLDVLDQLPEIQIAVGYRTQGGQTEFFPDAACGYDSIEPVYETLPGWMTSTAEARTLEDLPRNARGYLSRLQDVVGVPIRMVSVGTRRSEIIRV